MGVKGLYYASSRHGYRGAVGAQQRQQCALGDGRAGGRGGCTECQVCGSGWFGPGVVLVQTAQEGAHALPAKLAKGAGPAVVLSSGSCQGPGLLAELASKPPTALLRALLFSHKQICIARRWRAAPPTWPSRRPRSTRRSWTRCALSWRRLWPPSLGPRWSTTSSA